MDIYSIATIVAGLVSIGLLGAAVWVQHVRMRDLYVKQEITVMVLASVTEQLGQMQHEPGSTKHHTEH